MLIMDVYAQCQEHEPPHTVTLNTDSGGELPPLPCDGTAIAYEVDAECDCGRDFSGEYFPDERLPDHQCDEDEDDQCL